MGEGVVRGGRWRGRRRRRRGWWEQQQRGVRRVHSLLR